MGDSISQMYVRPFTVGHTSPRRKSQAFSYPGVGGITIGNPKRVVENSTISSTLLSCATNSASASSTPPLATVHLTASQKGDSILFGAGKPVPGHTDQNATELLTNSRSAKATQALNIVAKTLRLFHKKN